MQLTSTLLGRAAAVLDSLVDAGEIGPPVAAFIMPGRLLASQSARDQVPGGLWTPRRGYNAASSSTA